MAADAAGERRPACRRQVIMIIMIIYDCSFRGKFFVLVCGLVHNAESRDGIAGKWGRREEATGAAE